MGSMTFGITRNFGRSLNSQVAHAFLKDGSIEALGPVRVSGARQEPNPGNHPDQPLGLIRQGPLQGAKYLEPSS